GRVRHGGVQPIRSLRQLVAQRSLSAERRRRQRSRRGSAGRRANVDEQRVRVDEHELRSVRTQVLRRAFDRHVIEPDARPGTCIRKGAGRAKWASARLASLACTIRGTHGFDTLDSPGTQERRSSTRFRASRRRPRSASRSMGESTDYRRVFEQAPGLFLIVRPDPAFTVVDASDAYLRATFTPRETIVGRGLFDLLPKEPAATRAIAALRLRRSFERVIATGGADAMQIQRFDVLRPGPENGTVERYWSAVNSPVLSADGSLLYILHAIEDVTEFVHSSREEQESGDALRLEILHRGRQLAATNRELREVVSQFQALYEQGLYAARIALDGTLIDANRALLEETGIARQEVIGKPFWECGWWNRSAELQEWVKNAVGRAVGGEPFRGVSVYFRGDGKERIVDFAYLPIKDESGIVQFVFSTGMDITERVSAERNLRSTQILEGIAEGFFALDAEWRFIYVNREAQRLFGRAPNELIGRKIWTEIGGIEGNEFERVFRLAMDERIASARVTAFCAEHERWYELQSYPAENGITVYFRDVSAQVV